jgi:ornithine carbamoyltransferase
MSPIWGRSGSHIGTKETMKDTARVLGRFYDAIEYRGFGQADAEVLAAICRGAGL